MRKIFPKISFVNDLPLTDIERTLKDDQVLTGFFNYKDVYIVILKTKNQTRTLFHELGHWFIYLVALNSLKIHTWYDKHFTVGRVGVMGEAGRRQVRTRKERYKLVK